MPFATLACRTAIGIDVPAQVFDAGTETGVNRDRVSALFSSERH
jgi:hypothetical protein